jgi:hypothetical protein
MWLTLGCERQLFRSAHEARHDCECAKKLFLEMVSSVYIVDGSPDLRSGGKSNVMTWHTTLNIHV